MCPAYLQIGTRPWPPDWCRELASRPSCSIGNPGATAPTGKLGFFADQVMYCKRNGGP